MYISRFYIENFKLFSQVTLNALNYDLNILTGVNNSGKTTVLEAIALWHECFNSLIFKAKRADHRRGIRSYDYRFYISPKDTYFAAESVISVKKPKYDSLFYTERGYKLNFLVKQETQFLVRQETQFF